VRINSKDVVNIIVQLVVYKILRMYLYYITSYRICQPFFI